MSKMTKVVAFLLAIMMVVAVVAGCDKKDGDGSTTTNPSGTTAPSGEGAKDPEGNELGYTITEFPADATYTARSAMSQLPGNWNPHDYESDDASTIFGYLVDSFYNITYNDELHPVEGKDPFTTYTIIPSMAAGMPTDVTAEVKAAHPDWIPADATEGYAWAIPLRQDLCFDTGYKITAETYVQSMKYILDSRLANYRAADIYNGSQGIVGAEQFFKSGYSLDEFVSAAFGDDEYVNPSEFTLTDKGTYQCNGKDVVLVVADGGNWGLDGGVKGYASQVEQAARLTDAADKRGWTFLTESLLKDLQDLIAMLHGYHNVEEYAEAAGDYAYMEFEEMAYLGYEHEAVDYDSTVGFYAKDEYTLVQVFKGAVSGFYLYYGGIQDSLVLVEPDVYESCLKQDESGVWYSDYMTSKETSPSYGAYSMTSYQADKQVTYAKNDTWFGWHDDVNHVYKDPDNGNVYRTNQTTNIDIQVIKETATRRSMFLRGELTTFNLEESDYEQYAHSDYLWAYPSETCAGLWLTGNMAGLNAREAAEGFDQATMDVQTIGLKSFHKAMAVSFDKQAFCDEVHPAYLPGFGLLGNQYIYDPDTGAFYRDTDQAKQALCDFYSVDVSKFASLDEAVESITGYDPDAAKALFKDAYDEAIKLGYITDANNDGICDQMITMTYIVQDSGDDVMLRRIRFLNSNLQKVVEGTPFEGKVEIVESAPTGDRWLDVYRTGENDMFIVGVGGSMLNPFNAMGIYCDPNQNLTAGWYDPTADMMTLTVNGEEITMSVYDWYAAVNGTMVTVGEKTYSFGSADAEIETRITILAALEGKIMQCYDMLPLCNFGSKILLTQQCFNVCDEYNPMFEYGPRRYNYTDAEWAEYCAEQIAEHGSLQY